ncbi:MAG: DUF1302 family protein [Gammaproteobacteria bacterium]
MKTISEIWRTPELILLATGVFLCGSLSVSYAYTTKDGSFTLHGFVDNTTHQRIGARAGLSKMRNRGQLEFSKMFRPIGPFSEISISGTLRATYDAAYDLNDDEYGDQSGGSVSFESQGGPALGLPASVPWGATANPALGPVVLPATNPFVTMDPNVLNGFFLGPNGGTNPNQGLKILGSESFSASGGNPGFGGIQLAYPTRPCNVDRRGCIAGYMDDTENDLRFPEFNARQDWLREIYIDATLPLNNGDEVNFRIGRQQVVWGRTDLFRVLDQINPIDFSIQNIYEEFEDSRIPLGIFSAEYRAGATGPFDDLNFQFIWKFEKFRPATLGQGGEPYSILDAGNLFRALSTCWNFGCTVGNFAPNSSNALSFNPPFGPGVPALPPTFAGFGGGNATGLLATTFPSHFIGIRQANLPDSRNEFGVKLEGVYKDVGFSLNALYFHQQLPSLHGGSAGPPTINGFLSQTGTVTSAAGLLPPGGVPGFISPTGETFGTTQVRPYLIAFDINFPQVVLLGASADIYVEPIKSAFRIEVAHTNGEEFANTLQPSLFSRSRVIRWVVGWDRNTFIRFLNPNRAFLISAQAFGQHLLDHQLIKTPGGAAGMPDWKNNYIATLLFQGFYRNDRVQPRILSAWDVRARAVVVGPSVDWLITDHWRLTAGANFKFGRSKNEFDDVRAGNQVPPFTDPAEGTPGAGTLPVGQSINRIGGIAPLGNFRAGPIGAAQDEDEFQITLRFRF